LTDFQQAQDQYGSMIFPVRPLPPLSSLVPTMELADTTVSMEKTLLSSVVAASVVSIKLCAHGNEKLI